MPDPDHPAHFNPLGDLLDLVEARPEDRLLLVHGGPELLCSALRHGCRSAVSLAVPPRHPEAADLVVAEDVASQAEAVAVAESARRALGRDGRLALMLRGAAAKTARALRLRLHEYGFSRVRRQAGANGAVLLLCRYGAAR
ncbi:MAG: hypothetical protein JWR00_2112 [Rubritepida sp.]|nr:hypothetical protein [Rubritepida sp.]